jgi:hypothetical protein
VTRPADRAAAPGHGFRLIPVAGRGRPRLWMDSEVRSRQPAPVPPQPERRGIEVPDSLVQKERQAVWEEIDRALDALESSRGRLTFNPRFYSAS